MGNLKIINIAMTAIAEIGALVLFVQVVVEHSFDKSPLYYALAAGCGGDLLLEDRRNDNHLSPALLKCSV